MEVLRWAGRNMKDLVPRMEDVLCEAEETAVESAVPAPSAHSAIEAANLRGQATAIVSNNYSAAIKKYLHLHGLRTFVDVVIGRPYAEPERMKPNPQILIEALDFLGVKPESSFLIGHSVADIQACLRADVRPVGYAKDATRHLELVEAGAVAVADDMCEFLSV